MSGTRTASNIAIAAGFICLAVCAWSLIHLAVYQHRENQAFDEEIRSATVPANLTRRPAPGSVIGRLVIHRLHVRAIVREGAEGQVLDVALGHVPGTALPGQDGNVGIAGHRDTLFRPLQDIAKGDRIVLETAHGTFNYDVDRIGIVQPKDVGVLSPGSRPELTLVTCYPFRYVGSAPDRFIVQARLVTSP